MPALLKTTTKGFTLLALLVLAARAAAVPTILADQKALESDVTQRLQRFIDPIINPQDYRLIVSADLKKVRVKAIDKGEEKRIEAQSGQQAQVVAELPGFKRPEGEASRSETKADIKTAFSYTNKIIVNKIHVNLMVSPATPQATQDLARTLLQNDLKSSFGNKFALSVQPTKFQEAKPQPAKTFGTWLQEYLWSRGATGVDIIYLILISLAALTALYMLGRHGWRSFSRSRRALSSPASAAATAGPSGDHEAIHQLMTTIIERLMAQPLAVKQFLASLEDHQKAALVNSLSSAGLKAYVEGMITLRNPQAAASQTPPTLELQDLKRLERELDQFLSLQQWQAQRKFGFLAQLDVATLFELLPIKQLKLTQKALISRFLTPAQYAAMLAAMPATDKAQFLHLIESGYFDAEELNATEEHLRRLFGDAQESGLVDGRKRAELRTNLLEHDKDVPAIIDAMKSQGLKVPAAMKKYTLRFEDLGGLDQPTLKKLLETASNETIAKAFAHHGLTTEISQLLGQVRSKFIRGIMSHFKGTPTQDVEAAKLEIMRLYRRLI